MFRKTLTIGGLLVQCQQQLIRCASTTSTTSAASKLIERKIPIETDAGQKIDIHIVQAGLAPADAERTVLLMPGALGTALTDFRPQLEHLIAQGRLPADRWSVVAWDPPGYGASRPPQREFPVDFFQRDARAAAAVMRQLGCTWYSLCGWSDGGITAMVLAAERPLEVDRMVVWGANAYVVEEELKTYEGIRDVQKWSARMREPLEKIYGVEGFAQLWGAWIDGFTGIAKARNGDICRELLSCIQCPTLIVHGAKDPMIAAEHAPYLRKHIKGSEYYEFPDGKHNVHLRYAEEFNGVVGEFLRREC